MAIAAYFRLYIAFAVIWQEASKKEVALHSANSESKLPQKDIPAFQIPELCIGGLTCSPGDIANKHRGQNSRGTAHIHIRALSPWENRG
jgi:hypothetical protein